MDSVQTREDRRSKPGSPPEDVASVAVVAINVEIIDENCSHIAFRCGHYRRNVASRERVSPPQKMVPSWATTNAGKPSPQPR